MKTLCHLPRPFLLPGRGRRDLLGLMGRESPSLSVMSTLAEAWGLGRGSWMTELEGRTLGITQLKLPILQMGKRLTQHSHG